MIDHQRSSDEPVMALFRPVRFEFVDDPEEDRAGLNEMEMPSPPGIEEAARARSQAFRRWLSEHPDANG